jgi:hypothetical protein
MNFSRFNVFILSAAASMHALGAGSIESSKVLTVSGKAIPQACSLSVSPGRVDLATPDKEPTAVSNGNGWHFWKGKRYMLDVDVRTTCTNAVKTAIRFVDMSGVDMEGHKLGANRTLFGMSGAGQSVAGGYAIGERVDTGWNTAVVLYRSEADLVSGSGTAGGAGAYLGAGIMPGMYIGRALRVPIGQDAPVSALADAYYPLVLTAYRKVGTNSDALELSGSLLLELYTL